MMAEPPNLEQLRESVRRMGPNWVETDPNFEVSWWSIPDRDFQPFADAARFLLSVLDEGASLVVEKRCDMHGTIVHKWHPSAEKRAEYAQGCPGGYRKVVWPTEEEEE